jgi:uncharacterized membrane protein
VIERPRPPAADIDLPSRTDPVVTGMSQIIGGPVGDRARFARRFWTPMRVILALACLVFAFNWVQKSPCRDGAWAENMQYTKACYTDVLALYFAEGLNEGKVPYLDHPVEYPVLTGAFMGIIGLPVHALGQSEWVNDSLLPGLAEVGLAEGGPLNEAKLFYDLNALALGLFGLLAVWTVVRMRPKRPWDGAMVALAPAVFVTASVNWDLLAVGLCMLAILAWSRRALAWAGVLFGLAAAAKFFPLFILGPLFVLCWRRKRLPEFTITLSTAILTWLAVNVPVYVLARESWLRFFELNTERPVDWGTFWYIGANFPTGDGKVGLPVFTTLAQSANIPDLNLVSQAAFALACVGIAALIVFAPRPPRVGAVAFLVVAAFLLTNKVWSQQFVLWLVPLAVLARPRWTAFLAWQAAELAYFFGFYQILLRAAGGKSLMPDKWFALIGLARWVAVAVLCGIVVREILHPEYDVVRAGGEDDPEGGVLVDPHPRPVAEEEPAEEEPAADPEPESSASGRVDHEDDRVLGLGTP